LTHLLEVRVEITPDRDGELNEWYARHVPHLMRTPGYASGRRYLALEQGPRYAALYEIEHETYLPSLLGQETDRRHELTLVDLPAWDSDLVPHMARLDFNVWETAASGHVPVLVGNHPLVQVRFEASGGDADAVARYCDDELLPGLAGDADVLAVTRLRPSSHPAVEWIGTWPSALVLIQVAGERRARELATGDGLLRALADVGGVSEPEVSAYRQLLYHAPFRG
jgi:hypothetical protein